jgi:hypothetical protein
MFEFEKKNLKKVKLKKVHIVGGRSGIGDRQELNINLQGAVKVRARLQFLGSPPK